MVCPAQGPEAMFENVTVTLPALFTSASMVNTTPSWFWLREMLLKPVPKLEGKKEQEFHTKQMR
jgi:hypothetical protein